MLKDKALPFGVLFAALAVVMALPLGAANVWYVDDDSTVTPQTGSSAAPFTTIEQAVRAASANDTIYVRPGEYVAADAGYDSVNDVKAVACLTKKLRLESTEGRDKTFIIGRCDPDTQQVGSNAVACVWAAQSGCIVKGFTLKGGFSRTNNSRANISANHGGGFSCQAQGRDSYVVDCIVRDCVATRGGGLAFCTAIRTLLVNNWADGGHGRAVRYSNLYSCIIIANGNESTSTYGSGRGSDCAAADACNRIVNCTFVGNPAGGLEGGSMANIKIENTVATFSPGAKYGESLYVNEDLTTTVRYSVFDGVAFSPDETAKWSFDHTVTNASPYQCISPFEGDFRVEKGGLCDGTGTLDADWSDVPEEFCGKDYYGNPLVVNGKCVIGAVAATAVRKGGILHVSGWNANTPYIGTDSYRNTSLKNSANAAYVGSAVWPRQVYVKAGANSAGRTPVRFLQTGLGSIKDSNAPPRFPDYDGGVWFTMPPDGMVFTNYVKYATNIRYVNDATGKDDTTSGRGLSSDLPYKTIQAAIDAAANDDLILVAPGDYKDGTTTYNNFPTRVVLNKQVLLRAADRTKRAETIIRGYRDPDHYDEFVSGHVRPLRITSSHACVQGFTITEGCTIENSSQENGCGGLVRGNGVQSVVQDCTLSNGRGSRAGAVQSAWVIRCVLTNNTCGGQCTVRNDAASSCIFTENYNSSSWEVGVGVRVYNCSQYSSKMLGSDKHVAGEASYIYNSIFTGGAYGKPFWEKVTYERQGCWSDVNSMDGVTKTSPLFVAPGDFRLRADSEAVKVGGSTDSAIYGPEYFSVYTTDDINGNPIVFTADGKPMPGAVQTVASVVQVKQAVAGEATVESSVALDADGKAVVAAGDTVTLTASGSAKRKFLGFNVGDTRVESSEKTYTWTAADNCLEPTVLSVAYNTNWYVNPDSSYLDTNDGWTPATARRSLVAAVADAVPGDTVHLAEGTYAENTATVGSYKTLNRVVVPEAVTLVGDGDRANTVIQGVGGLTKAASDANVRCVYLCKNAAVRNVTIEEGAVAGDATGAGPDDYAGGVIGTNAAPYTARVEECLLRNNYGGRAGAMAWVTAMRCRVLGNAAGSTGSAGRNVDCYGCFFDDNAGGESLLNGYALVDCTFGAGNGQPPVHQKEFKGALMANCVILTPNATTGNGVICQNISNCVIAAGTTLTINAGGTQGGVVQTYTAAELKVDANGRPAKDSPLVDYNARLALASDAKYLGALDIDGMPRVSGARQDLGCCEYDWRPALAQDIGKGFTVTSADAGIAETADGVYVPGGAITLLRGNARKTTTIRGHVAVTGTGTLVLTLNGEEKARYTAGAYDFRLFGDGTGDQLVCTYEPGANDAGGATLSDFMGAPNGMILLMQ